MWVRGVHRLALVALAPAALLAAGGLTPPAARAASCSGASHAVTLNAGSASPGSGTTGTAFTFAVFYASNAGCPPAVTVTVNGVGTYGMSPGSTDYAAGATFWATLNLPPGTYGYSFHAASGSGSGTQAVTLTSVSPGAISVFAPAPVVVPPPETPPFTPTPPPSASPAADGGSPSGIGIGPTAVPGSRAGGWGLRAGPMPLWTPPTPAPSIDLPATPGSVGGVVWATATVGGLALLLFLNRRPSLAGRPALDARGAEMALDPVQPERMRRPPPVGEEGQVARWLRPSVQAARFADPGREAYPEA